MEFSDSKSGRRQFIIQSGTLLGIGIMGTVVPGLLSSCQRNEGPVNAGVKKEIDVTQYPDLQMDLGAVKETFQGLNENLPIMIVRISEGNFVVFNTKCTHEACEVDLPDSAIGTILCSCHGSFFNQTDGKVLNGPATKDLVRFPSTFDPLTNILTVTI